MKLEVNFVDCPMIETIVVGIKIELLQEMKNFIRIIKIKLEKNIENTLKRGGTDENFRNFQELEIEFIMHLKVVEDHCILKNV